MCIYIYMYNDLHPEISIADIQGKWSRKKETRRGKADAEAARHA